MRKFIIVLLGLLVGFFALACNQDFQIKKISPSVGLLGGGEQVEVLGNGFDPNMGVTVYFGNRQADNVVVSSTDKLIVMTPGNLKAEMVDMRIAMDNGKEYIVRDGFRYVEKASMDIRDLGKRKSLRDKP